jgi:hypothetical protein
MRAYNSRGWDLLTPGTGLIICQDHYYTGGILERAWARRGRRVCIPNLTGPQRVSIFASVCTVT